MLGLSDALRLLREEACTQFAYSNPDTQPLLLPYDIQHTTQFFLLPISSYELVLDYLWHTNP